MIRSCGNLKRRLPSRRCIFHRLCRSSASHKSIFRGLPQVACFDTTFHADLAEVARVLPISKELQLEGIQRYGFHGLSCESIVHQLAKGWQLRGRGRSQRLSADAAATAGGTSGAPRNAMFNLAPCLTVTKDFFWRYHKHPRPILRLTHRAPARGALHCYWTRCLAKRRRPLSWG